MTDEKFDWAAYADEAQYATYDPDDNKLRIYTDFVPREMYDAFRKAGFGRAPKQGCFFQVWTPAREDVALALCGEIEDEDSTVFDRAEDRGARFAGYSANAARRAEEAIKAGDAAVAGIPFGQPILVGHHSERKHRKALERAQRAADRTVEEVDRRDYWRRRAEGVLRHAAHRHDRGKVLRRIKKLESDLRKKRNEKDGKDYNTALGHLLWDLADKHPAEFEREGGTPYQARVLAATLWATKRETPDGMPETAARLRRWQEGRDRYLDRCTAHLEGQIEYWKTILGEKHGEDLDDQMPLAKSCWVRCAYGWAQVQRVNKGAEGRITSVSLDRETATWNRPGHFYPRKIDYDRILETKTDDEYRAMTYAEKNEAELERLKKAAEAAKRREAERETDALRREAEAQQETANGTEVKVNWNPDYFPTPPDVVEMMLNEVADVLGDHKGLLEPSAGDGRVIERACARWPHVSPGWYEIDPAARLVLREKGMAGMERGHDFLEAEPEPVYDAVVMNPPFGRQQGPRHVRHAWGFLKPGGMLVTVLPGKANYSGANDDRFCEWAWENAYFWGTRDLPDGTFKEAGTNVAAHILVLRKPAPRQPRLL